MVFKVVMPKLAMGMSQGTVTGWNYQPGQFVEKGAILLTIETEKVSYEIEAANSGYLNIVVGEGETVPVHTPIGYLAETEAELATLPERGGSAADGLADDDSGTAAPSKEDADAHGDSVRRDGRVIASPLARKLARNNDVDLAKISGSGPKGRIVKKDVLAYIESRHVAAPSEEHPPVQDVAGDPKGAVKAIVPVKGMRKSIGAGMKRSLEAAAQLSYSAEIDATEMLALRKRLVAKEDKLGVKVSVFDLLVLVFARAIRKVPIVNASFMGDEIKVWEDVNLGIAIATEISEYEGGLYVPVIKNAGMKSLFEISSEIKTVTQKTREGKLTLEDMQGGTVTISSVSFVSPLFASTPILNEGEALLIQPGSIQPKPVVRDGEIVIRQMITISFTFDHRVVDGIPLGRLTNHIKAFMEDPEMLL